LSFKHVLFALPLLLGFIYSSACGDDPEQETPTTLVFPAYKHTYGIRKAGPTELFLFMGLRVKFRNPQGLACVRLDAWEDKENPHDDDEVTVYGVNSGQNNIIFNSSMWSLGVYGLDEDGEQQLKEPNGITANSRGDVYVADSGNHRIVRLFNPGDRLEFVRALGSEGGKPGQFRYPLQVTLDALNQLYVSDTGNHRIQVFNENDSLLKIIAASGQLLSPNGIAVAHRAEKYRYQADNFIIVVDSIDQRISKLDFKGNVLIRKNISDLGYMRGTLEYVCLDYYNQILITDSWNHCIHKLDKNLNHILSFGQKGDDDHQFNEPRGIALYRRFGQLFVAEKSGAQYYWIGTDITRTEILEKENGILISLDITEPSFIYADIYDNSGHFVQRIANKHFVLTAGTHTLFWNLKIARKLPKDIEGSEILLSPVAGKQNKVSTGTYKLKIRAEATYSSRTYFSKEVEKEFTIGN
jgi:hypothetical protein